MLIEELVYADFKQIRVKLEFLVQIERLTSEKESCQIALVIFQRRTMRDQRFNLEFMVNETWKAFNRRCIPSRDIPEMLSNISVVQ